MWVKTNICSFTKKLQDHTMEVIELILVALMILGVLISLLIGMPMRKHLLAQTEIKKIGLFQMPFYLKDYHRMISETIEVSKKKKFQTYFTIFMISNLSFILFAIILLLIPGSLL